MHPREIRHTAWACDKKAERFPLPTQNTLVVISVASTPADGSGYVHPHHRQQSPLCHLIHNIFDFHVLISLSSGPSQNLAWQYRSVSIGQRRPAAAMIGFLMGSSLTYWCHHRLNSLHVKFCSRLYIWWSINIISSMIGKERRSHHRVMYHSVKLGGFVPCSMAGAVFYRTVQFVFKWHIRSRHRRTNRHGAGNTKDTVSALPVSSWDFHHMSTPSGRSKIMHAVSLALSSL